MAGAMMKCTLMAAPFILDGGRCGLLIDNILRRCRPGGRRKRNHDKQHGQDI